MSDYVKTADYAAKDSLPAGNLAKVVRGTELGADFDAIAVAITSKYDSTDLGVTLQQHSADTVVFASGTRLLFQQTSAPTGWTKVTTHNDAVLRVVSGVVGSGGTDEFTTLFGTSKSTASYTLLSADMPSHTHGVTDPGHYHTLSNLFYYTSGNTWTTTSASLAPSTHSPNTDTKTTGITLQNTGGGGGHSHTLNNMNLKYADCIIASKD